MTRKKDYPDDLTLEEIQEFRAKRAERWLELKRLGYSGREIADRYNVSANTVYSRLRRITDETLLPDLRKIPAEMFQHFLEGEPIGKLAEQYGFDAEYVRTRILYTLRRKGIRGHDPWDCYMTGHSMVEIMERFGYTCVGNVKSALAQYARRHAHGPYRRGRQREAYEMIFVQKMSGKDTAEKLRYSSDDAARRAARIYKSWLDSTIDKDS